MSNEPRIDLESGRDPANRPNSLGQTGSAEQIAGGAWLAGNGHAFPGDKVWTTRAKDDDSNADSHFPASTVLATGNGDGPRTYFFLKDPQWRGIHERTSA